MRRPNRSSRAPPRSAGSFSRGTAAAMAVLIDEHTRLLVQGLTGREGTFHAKQAAEFGTTVVGGVTPGKGGTTHEGWPVFNTVQEAVRETGANASVIFVPPALAADAIMEAADAGVAVAVCITEGIPTIDMLGVVRFLETRPTRLIGRTVPGSSRPGRPRRNHPWPYLSGGSCRDRFEERDAYLRGNPPAHSSISRSDDLPRHRRRPAAWYQFH